MLPRKYRRMPKDFLDFSKRFGCSVEEISQAIANPYVRKRVSAEEALKKTAREYIKFFRRHPNKIHLFPMTGMVFQYWFAKGVRDGAKLSTKLRTIATERTFSQDDPVYRHKVRDHIISQAQKLGLNKGVAMHDLVVTRRTKKDIASASGLRLSQVPVHSIERSLEHPDVLLNVFKVVKGVASGSLVGKDFSKEKLNLSPMGSSLSEREQAFVKRVFYAAGVSAAKELLAQKKRK